ncbi:MAG: hypothetical protein HY280_07825 [Nitrospinae bacterium]|nr:hypothetical protein [Nitrospinota bacterium]
MARLSPVFATISALLFFAGCGEGESKPNLQSPTSGSVGIVLKDWVGVGVNTVTTSAALSSVNHSEYLLGSHASYTCADCHNPVDSTTGLQTAIQRDQICARCHPFSRYSAVTTSVDHVALKSGTHCNACHHSASGASLSTIIGWRWSSVTSPIVRVTHKTWHGNVKGTCLNCHTLANETLPSSHPAVTSATACEPCHHYSNGKWAGQHRKVTSGCNISGCHTGHYSGNDCSLCHTGAAAGGYTNWAISFSKGGHQIQFGSASCGICHSGGFGD